MVRRRIVLVPVIVLAGAIATFILVRRGDLAAEVTAMRAAWHEASIQNYTLRLQIDCFCDVAPPDVKIRVNGGEVASIRLGPSLGDGAGKALDAEQWQRMPMTVDALFDKLDEAHEGVEGSCCGPADVIDVTYDQELHYPASVDIDWELDSIDDEFAWNATVRPTRLISVSGAGL